MEFVSIPGGNYELGWRFDASLPQDVKQALQSFMPMDELLTRFSPARTVTLPSFEIATTALDAEDLLGELDDDDFGELLDLADVCNKLDELLEPRGLRVPSEDELEAACGGRLFTWGDEWPGGIPYGDKTDFGKHREPTALGLFVDGDTYVCEVARLAMKLGDGGEAVCGGYPWPVPWLALSPSHRLAGDAVDDLLFEFLEGARVRPVKR